MLQVAKISHNLQRIQRFVCKSFFGKTFSFMIILILGLHHQLLRDAFFKKWVIIFGFAFPQPTYSIDNILRYSIPVRLKLLKS